MTPETVDAARRLAHDVGKYVRFGAPEEPERDAGELRERLTRDLLATRRSGETSESVLDVFDAWRREEGGSVADEPLLATRFREVEEALSEIARLLPRIAQLDEHGLRELDDAALLLSRRCRELARAARSA